MRHKREPRDSISPYHVARLACFLITQHLGWKPRSLLLCRAIDDRTSRVVSRSPRTHERM